MRPAGPIRVLVIDDLSVLRNALTAELERCGDLHATGCTSDVAEVRDRLLQLHPEVIVLDLDVRRTTVFVLLTKLRANYPVPIIVGARANDESTERALKAIERGACDVVRKPANVRQPGMEQYARELALKIRTVTTAARPVARAPVASKPITSTRAAGVDPARHLIVLGASTGGTQAITALMEHVPADLPPIVIVQHMPPGFTRSFAERVNSLSAMRVTEAVDGETVGPGRAVIARGDTHLEIRPAAIGCRVVYTHTTPRNRHCPSVDVLFESALPFAQNTVAVLLTGMGADGARGMLQLRQAGALTVAQDARSSVVYGMPKEAVNLGAVMHSAPPHEIPIWIVRQLAQRSPHRNPSLSTNA